MLKRIDAISSGLVDLSPLGRIQQQQQQRRCPSMMTNHIQSDPRQVSLKNDSVLKSVQKNLNSFRTLSNVCSTSTHHPRFENNRQSFDISERTNPIPRFANGHNESYSRSVTSHSSSYEEINVKIRRVTSDNRDNFQILQKNSPFSQPAQSHAFNSQINNRFTPQHSQSSEHQVLLKKLSDLGCWLIQNKKLESDRTLAPCILDSAMNEFGLNLRFTWLPNKRMMLVCSLGSSQVMIYNQSYVEKHSAEQIACHSAIERLTEPYLKILSKEGHMDTLTTSKVPIEKSSVNFTSKQANKYEFTMMEKVEAMPREAQTNDNYSDNSRESMKTNPLIQCTQLPIAATQSVHLLTSQDVNQLTYLSQQSKHQGLLEKLTSLGNWLRQKNESDINIFSVSDLLKSAASYFNLNLKYKWLPEGVKPFTKVVLFCSLGSSEVLICSSKCRQNENPEQVVCLKAIEKLGQPYLKIFSVEGSVDLLIDSDFPIDGNCIPMEHNLPASQENKTRNKRKRRRSKKHKKTMLKMNAAKGKSDNILKDGDKNENVSNIEKRNTENLGNVEKNKIEDLNTEEHQKENFEKMEENNNTDGDKKNENVTNIEDNKNKDLKNVEEKKENLGDIKENKFGNIEEKNTENLRNIEKNKNENLNTQEHRKENFDEMMEENNNNKGEQQQSAKASAMNDECLMFVDGLWAENTEKSVRNYFSKFGAVDIVSLKKDGEKACLVANVLFKKPSSLAKVILHGCHNLNGNIIYPRRAKDRPEPKIFISGLKSGSQSEVAVREYFGKFGYIKKVEFPVSKMKTKPLNLCFITLRSEQIVDDICKQSIHVIGSDECYIRKATPADERAAFPVPNQKKKRTKSKKKMLSGKSQNLWNWQDQKLWNKWGFQIYYGNPWYGHGQAYNNSQIYSRNPWHCSRLGYASSQNVGYGKTKETKAHVQNFHPYRSR